MWVWLLWVVHYYFYWGNEIFAAKYNELLPVCRSDLLVCVCSSSVLSDSAIPWTVSRSGSSVHGMSQTRIVEWVAVSSSRGSIPPRLLIHFQAVCSYIICSSLQEIKLWKNWREYLCTMFSQVCDFSKNAYLECKLEFIAPLNFQVISWHKESWKYLFWWSSFFLSIIRWNYKTNIRIWYR